MPDDMTPELRSQLASDLRSARRRTLSLIEGLDAEQLLGPKLRIVNPLLWEIGHVAYFHEFWVRRECNQETSFLQNADALYDSISIAHDDRWNLPLLSLQETLDYMDAVHAYELQRIDAPDLSEREIYLIRYAIYHEDMHTEAFTYSRQTLEYPSPRFGRFPPTVDSILYKADAQDVVIPAGTYRVGAERDSAFCFDNEKWAHDIELAAFQISRFAVSNAQFLEFVDSGGYTNQRYWSDEGWAWRESRCLHMPVYWRRQDGQIQIRKFNQWETIDPAAALVHVSWHEAMAWCQWAGRRLPTEAEWEVAASAHPSGEQTLYPWGNTLTTKPPANLDGYALGTVSVAALPESDSGFGCRQMLGNVWEWTSTTFAPYEGFVADMYQDYSQPLFGETKVLRGGAWATRSRMIRNTWRNYYGPDRNDVFAGFRTCAQTSTELNEKNI